MPEATRLEIWNHHIALKYDRRLSSMAAEVHVKFYSDWTILNSNLTASRLCEILQYFNWAQMADHEFLATAYVATFKECLLPKNPPAKHTFLWLVKVSVNPKQKMH